MGRRFEVLDHGYLEIIETYGSDERIIEAARQSTQKGFLGWGSLCAKCDEPIATPMQDVCLKCGNGTYKEGDQKLLRYLWENNHPTPFEFAGAVIEVQAPIFVFREWHRHRTQSYNEMSARYVPMPDVCYVPSVERAMVNSKLNRQAGTVADADELTESAAADLLTEERDLLEMVEDLYQRKLKAGFPKELARTHLTVSRFSRMRASANLRNWLAFLTLREAPNAQWEIRQYANALHTLLAERFPRVMVLFEEKR